MAIAGERAGLDVVGQLHQVQKRLGRCIRRELCPLEGGGVVMAVMGCHTGTSSISSAAWRWASQRGQPFISARVSA